MHQNDDEEQSTSPRNKNRDNARGEAIHEIGRSNVLFEDLPLVYSNSLFLFFVGSELGTNGMAKRSMVHWI